MRNPELGMVLPAAFFIVWIFIGNWILLNLFLAILLDSFLVEGDASELTEEQEKEKALLKEKRKEEKERNRIRKLKKLGMSQVAQSGNMAMLRL
jgi:hypothetical protein